MIDAETGNHLWAERFDKPVADLFDLQDEIVARLANTQSSQLIEAEARRAERSPHPDATDLTFQGRARANKGMTREYMMQAQAFYQRALAFDPGNTEALVGSASADALAAAASMADDGNTRFAAAETSVSKALSMAPQHASAHLVLGIVQMFTNRPVQGLRECEQALALDPNLAEAHAWAGMAKYFLGRGAETERHVNEALRLSPRDSLAFRWMQFVGVAKIQVGAHEEAVFWLRRCVEANQNHPLAYFHLAGVMTLLGELDEARAAVSAGLKLDPTFTIRRMRAAVSSTNEKYLEGRERLIKGMRIAGVPEG